jgi:hypothetical protein
MTRITADVELRTKLLGFTQEIELCDETGLVLARVKPVADLSHLNLLTKPVSNEELDRRSKSSEKRYSTQEVVDYLEKL